MHFDETKFCEALAASGLPKDPTQVIGRHFMFGYGPHIIAGTVIGIKFDERDGIASVAQHITLYVSTPEYRNLELRRLSCLQDGVWAIDPTLPMETHNTGSFKLL